MRERHKTSSASKLLARTAGRVSLAFYVFAALLALQGCVEELDLETLSGTPEQGLLVVEAVLTDRNETQEVILSRSEARFDIETDTVYNPFLPFGLGQRDTLTYESGATVRLVSSAGQGVEFSETETGRYSSIQPFGLQEGTGYFLEIRTTDGREYRSDTLRVAGVAALQNVYAERTTNAFGVEGIQIYGDAAQVRGSASRLRFNYEETYKIIAPSWNNQDFQLTNYDPCALPAPTYDLQIVERQQQNRVCYNTVAAQSIVQASIDPSAGSLRRFPIRFIPRDDFIITHRYSILVKQYVQSVDAYSYFETLSAFAGNDDLFSQLQPGVLAANVSRVDGTRETVLGYVEAVSSSEQRIFFNYNDYFPGESLPPYPITCLEQSSPESHRSYCATGMDTNTCPQSIIERVNLGTIAYTGENTENIGSCPGPYTFVNRACGDCTLLGENVEPEFWQE